eukprot:Gb_40776 [translate_table: standard]
MLLYKVNIISPYRLHKPRQLRVNDLEESDFGDTGAARMVLICFVLDLSSFQPSLLKDLKQCLLQLANLYAVRKAKCRTETCSPNSIGLCCIQKNNASGSNELRIAYLPKENFNLRDFHHAVNSLSVDCLVPRSKAFEFPQHHGQVSCLGALFTNKEGLYSWGPQSISRKVVMISSHFIESITSFRKMLLDAADHCVTVEFIQIESDVPQHVQWGNFTESMLSERIKEFTNSVSELENCMFHRVQRDYWILCSLIKRWLQDITDELEEPLQVVILFKDNVVESTNKIFCNLFPSTMQIADKFRPCQTCRCHGATIDTTKPIKFQRDGKSVCPITGQELDTYDVAENGLRIGSETILLLPSFKKIPKVEPLSMPVILNVIECINLASLSEGLFFGSSYVMLPSSNHEMDVTTEDGDQIETNHQIFSAFCQILNSMDRGLICTSTSDIESMCEATLPCFYLLQPSDSRAMLLRRIAAAEEFLPIPDAIEAVDTTISDELRGCIDSYLSKMEFRDYNPLNHERGCHMKLNWLVKESLQFRSTPMPMPLPKQHGQLNPHIDDNKHKHGSSESKSMKIQMHDRSNISPCHIVEQIPSILERMEPLRTFNKLTVNLSPSTFKEQYQSGHTPQYTQAHAGSQTSNGITAMKKPLVSFQQSQLLSSSPSPKLKPNFRRIKRSKN